MVKKLSVLACLSMGAIYFAQDATIIKNTAEVYSVNSLTGTAKYNAMAGSMGALGGDVSAISTNPAASAVFITGDITGTIAVQDNKNTSSLFGNSFQSSYAKTNLAQVGGVVSFAGRNNSPWKYVNLAFNYNANTLENYVQTPGNSNIRETIEYTDNSNNTVSDDLVFNGHGYDRIGTTSNMTIALGGNYDHKMYLGGALNFKSADLEQGDFFELRLQNLGEKATYYKQYSPYSEVSNGFSVSMGVIGKLSNNIRLGASVESPTVWNIQRSYVEYGLNNSNQWVSDIFDEDRTLTTPMKLTLSGALVASKNLAVNVDYTIGVTKPKYKVYGDAETQLNNFFASDYENASELKLGGEYRVKGMRLRAGYGMQNNPLKPESLAAFTSSGTAGTVKLENPLIGKRESLAGGLGYDFKSFYIDAALQKVTSTYDNPFFGGKYAVTANDGFSVTDGDGVDNATSIVSEVKNDKTNFFLTLGWKF